MWHKNILYKRVENNRESLEFFFLNEQKKKKRHKRANLKIGVSRPPIISRFERLCPAPPTLNSKTRRFKRLFRSFFACNRLAQMFWFLNFFIRVLYHLFFGGSLVDVLLNVWRRWICCTRAACVRARALQQWLFWDVVLRCCARIAVVRTHNDVINLIVHGCFLWRSPACRICSRKRERQRG